MSDNVDLRMLVELVRQNLDETRQLRRELAEVKAELAEVKATVTEASNFSRRLERRMYELRDDMELVVRSEVMERASRADDRTERVLSSLTRRVEALESRSPN